LGGGYFLSKIQTFPKSFFGIVDVQREVFEKSSVDFTDVTHLRQRRERQWRETCSYDQKLVIK